MPKIPSLIKAEQGVEFAVASTLSQQKQIDSFREQIESLQDKINLVKRPFLDALANAYNEQDRCLTKWINTASPESKHNYTRYRLRQSGKSDLCWDRRAWLRFATLTGFNKPVDWKWSLDVNQVNAYSRKVIQFPEFPDHPDYDLLRAEADKHLIAAGWILTDLLNE